MKSFKSTVFDFNIEALRGDEWKIEGDLVLKEEKIYIPKDEKLRLEVIWIY